MSKMKKMFKFSTKNKAADPSEWTKNDEKLQVAILANDYEKSELLIVKKGVTPTKVNLQGLTTLHRVAAEGNFDALRFLQEKDVDLSTVDFHGQTPMHCAAKAGQVEILNCLLQQVPHCLTSLDHNDLLPLHHACMGGSLEAARLLLNAGAEIDAKDKVGRTPLFIAARLGHQSLVKELLDKRANINHRDLDKKTALMFATEYNHIPVVDYLVKRGANVLLTDSAGHNAVWYAEETENDELKDILENAPSRASWSLDAVDNTVRRREHNGPKPDSEDVVARFVPEPEEHTPPPRPIPPSRKSKHAPPPPKPPSSKGGISPPPEFGSHSQQQLAKLEHAVVPMDEAPDDVEEEIQIAHISQTFEMSSATSNPIVEEGKNNFGRFSPEAVAAVEALIEETKAVEDVNEYNNEYNMPQVDPQAYTELEEENESLNDEVRRVSVERKKLQDKVEELERKLSDSDQEGVRILSENQRFNDSIIMEQLEKELTEAREQITLDKGRINHLEDEVKVLRKQVDIDSKPEAERNTDDSWNDSDDDLFESEHDAKKKIPASAPESTVVASLRSRILSLEKEVEESKEGNDEERRLTLLSSETTTERDLEAMNQFSELQQAHDLECQQLQTRIDELMDENFLVRKELAGLNSENAVKTRISETDSINMKSYSEVEGEELHQLIDMIGTKANAPVYDRYGQVGEYTMEEELIRLQSYVEMMRDTDTVDGSGDTETQTEVLQKKYERSLRDLARAKEDFENLEDSQAKRNAEMEEIAAQVESLQEIAQYSNELQQENDRLKEDNRRLMESKRESPIEDHNGMAKLTMQLQQENNDLKSDNRSLKSQLSDIETSLKETLSQREQDRLLGNPLEEENASLKLEIDSLRREVKESVESSTSGDHGELFSQITHLKKTISQQEETIFELMQQSTRDAQLRADYEQLQNESEVLNSNIVDFQNLMAKKGLETEQRMDALEQTIQSLQAENSKLKQTQAEMELQEKEDKSSDIHISDRVTELLAANTLLEEENNKMSNKMFALEVEVQRSSSLQREKEALEDEKLILERKVVESEETAKLWSVKLEGVEMETQSFKQDKETLLKDVTKWQEEALKLQADVSEAASDRIALRHMQDEYNALREQNESLDRKLAVLEADAQDDTRYLELKSKVRDLEEKLESEQSATVMAILDGRTEEQKNTETQLKEKVREMSTENERLKKELDDHHTLQANGNAEEEIAVVSSVALHASIPDTNGHVDNNRFGSSLKRRSEEMRLKEVEEENERLKSELDKLRHSPNSMQMSAANQHLLILQEKFEQMEKRHRDVVSTYRTHLLSAVQGRMDAGVSHALKNIIKIRMAPEVDV